ncbi:MAG: radical SAM protein [Nitrospina sp.]|jgi:radical SAM superfamily enzyme YgiQ (UPF0313 family)|nr:radical SAM protein [Nitrospina sp.]
MIVYLADLAHDYLPARQFVPLGIGYLASYSKSIFGEKVEFHLFKSVDKLLDECEVCEPDLVGFANYTWNERLNAFAGGRLKKEFPELPIVMGGPNIDIDEKGIGVFLGKYPFVDVYCMYSGEVSFSNIIQLCLENPTKNTRVEMLRSAPVSGGYSLFKGNLLGSPSNSKDSDLDFIPSPYLTGTLDPFLKEGFIPLIETNRGCPFLCTFCVWGVAALNKIQRFSMDRVYRDLDYVTQIGENYPQLVFADANFGILKRDVDIAKHIRKVYENTHTFASIEVYWSKSAQEHIVEIGRTLGHLTNTYIAFQSLDDGVLESIKRSNISTTRLVSLITRLKEYTHTTRTDILVGLPGESFDSHLESLDKALSYGINDILGGEVQLLPGSEMNTLESRDKFGLRTKYRFFEGCSGIYKGETIFELQEVIRETNNMSETEMIRLRALRALFFGGLTLGDLRPLVPYLTNKGVRLTDLLKTVILEGSNHPVLCETFEWLRNQISAEWFETVEEMDLFFRDPQNSSNFFSDKMFVKLNFAFTAHLLLHPNQFEAYYQQIEKEVLRLLPNEPQSTIREIVKLCQEQNFLYRCLRGDITTSVSIKLSDSTLSVLKKCGYLDLDYSCESFNLDLELDQLTADGVLKKIGSGNGQLSIFNLTQIMQMYRGRLQMKPLKSASVVLN